MIANWAEDDRKEAPVKGYQGEKKQHARDRRDVERPARGLES